MARGHSARRSSGCSRSARRRTRKDELAPPFASTGERSATKATDHSSGAGRCPTSRQKPSRRRSRTLAAHRAGAPRGLCPSRPGWADHRRAVATRLGVPSCVGREARRGAKRTRCPDYLPRDAPHNSGQRAGLRLRRPIALNQPGCRAASDRLRATALFFGAGRALAGRRRAPRHAAASSMRSNRRSPAAGPEPIL